MTINMDREAKVSRKSSLLETLRTISLIRNKVSMLKSLENEITIIAQNDDKEGVAKHLSLYVCHHFEDCVNEKIRMKMLVVIRVLFDLFPKILLQEVFVDYLYEDAKKMSSKRLAVIESEPTMLIFKLKVSCYLMTKANDSSSEDSFMRKLISMQKIYVRRILAWMKPKLLAQVVSILSEAVKMSVTGVIYERFLPTLIQPNEEDAIFLSSLVLAGMNAPDWSPVMNVFCDFVLALPVEYVGRVVFSCSYISRELVKEKNFLTYLMPRITRGLKRNPDVTMKYLVELLQYAGFDGILPMDAIFKEYLSHLIASEHERKELACLLTAKLAGNCTNKTSVLESIKIILNSYDSLRGSTSRDAKKNLIQALANINHAYDVLSLDDAQNIALVVLDRFVEVLQSEINEKVISVTLEALELWLRKWVGNIPDNVISVLLDNMRKLEFGTKLKFSYFHCLITLVETRETKESDNFIIRFEDILKSTMLFADSLTVNTPSLTLSQILAAILLLLPLNQKIGPRLDVFNYLQARKDLLLNIHYLNAVNVEEAEILAKFIFQFLRICEKDIFDDSSAFYKAILHMTTFRNKDIRKHFDLQLKEYFESEKENGIHLWINLLRECEPFMQNIYDIEKENKKEEMKTKDVDRSHMWGAHTSSGMMRKFIGFLFNPFYFSNHERIPELLFVSLLPLHHPCLIGTGKSEFWIKLLVKQTRIAPEDFLNEYKQKITNLFQEEIVETKNPESIANAISTIVSRNDDWISIVVERPLDFLNSDALLSITKEQLAISNLPDGELYDKTVYERVKAAESKETKNIRRENKAYSYKEQLEEVELKRELEEKKRLKGKKVEEPSLSEVQKEIINAQLKKESDIRSMVKSVLERSKRYCAVIGAACEKNSISGIPGILKSMHLIVPSLICNMASVSCMPVVELFAQLKDCCICLHHSELKSLAITLSHLTLHLLNINNNAKIDYGENGIRVASEKILSQLEEHGRMISAAFVYCFPYLSLIAMSSNADASIIKKVFAIISQHCVIPDACNQSSESLYAPRFLPRQDMMQFLGEMIERLDGTLQISATDTLVDVAKTCSSKPGFTLATLDEIKWILDSMESENSALRLAAAKALREMISSIPTGKKNRPLLLNISKRVWIAKFDVCAENRESADEVYALLEPNIVTVGLCEKFLEDVPHCNSAISEATASALAQYIRTNEMERKVVFKKLVSMYDDYVAGNPPVSNDIGSAKKSVDTTKHRCGVAVALGKLIPIYGPDQAIKFAEFFVTKGFLDKSEEVQSCMLKAAIALAEYGRETVIKLLPTFEKGLRNIPDGAEHDNARSNCIIMMARIAQHLQKDDAKFKSILNKLLDVLSTPSQQVQISVANCLPPLVSGMGDETGPFLKQLCNRMTKGNSYVDRKGAAYALAGAVKGAGMMSLGQHKIVEMIQEALQDKKQYKSREGALFGIATLSASLGKLFEPYLVNILPSLLVCFGDSSNYVREASHECSRIVMENLSSHGVRLLLPSLLKGMQDESWRIKEGAIELLGSMAYCAPKQLSACLPSIVPQLVLASKDSHVVVQETCKKSLNLIGSVVRNSEIRDIVPILLEAMVESKKNTECLSQLINIKFVHMVDAPSLALIMPVIERSLYDRSSETRKMAAKIVGTLSSLTQPSDLVPYLDTLIPALKCTILDATPEVRTATANTLGRLVKDLGEDCFNRIIDWLKKMLTSENGTVDRAGAAQGLSEIIGGFGVAKLDETVPEIIEWAMNQKVPPYVRDGYLMMLIYLPAVFKDDFIPYMTAAVPPILKALADESEYVRETALNAGQRIVYLYADSAIQLLLPELESGLFQDNWRIRYSSVQLLGDLLYHISGVTGKMNTETIAEDENYGTEGSNSAIISTLGAERRNRVLAGLYMARSDTAATVKHQALHVWKVVVSNTPRTLREIMNDLVEMILNGLSEVDSERTRIAKRTLDDLAKKLGDRVLPEMLPYLQKGLSSNESLKRRGICVCLTVVMCASLDCDELIRHFSSQIIQIIRDSLCDEYYDVRAAAADAFEMFCRCVRPDKAGEQLLGPMLIAINADDEDAKERSLVGFQHLISTYPNLALPFVIHHLSDEALDVKTLSLFATSAGEQLSDFMPPILSKLMSSANIQSELEMEHCTDVVLAVTDEGGVLNVIKYLTNIIKKQSGEERLKAIYILSSFCNKTTTSYAKHTTQLIQTFIHLLSDKSEIVLKHSWFGLDAIVKRLGKGEMYATLNMICDAIADTCRSIKKKDEFLPGFCYGKGITPLLPVFRESLLTGDTEVKSVATMGIFNVIKYTDEKFFHVSIVPLTGPLIRVLGERFSPPVRCACLQILIVLIQRVGNGLRVFMPQLYTTLLKGLLDPSREVRLKTGEAVQAACQVHGRTDLLFIELIHQYKDQTDPHFRETLMHNLRMIILATGERLPTAARANLFSEIYEFMTLSEQACRLAAAGCAGSFIGLLPQASINSLINDVICGADKQCLFERSTCFYVALKEHPSKICVEENKDVIYSTLVRLVKSETIPLITNGLRGCAYVMKHLITQNTTVPQQFLDLFVESWKTHHKEIRLVIAYVCVLLISPDDNPPTDLVKRLIPELVNGYKSKDPEIAETCKIALTAGLKLAHENDVLMTNCMLIFDDTTQKSIKSVVNKINAKDLSPIVTEYGLFQKCELDITLIE